MTYNEEKFFLEHRHDVDEMVRRFSGHGIPFELADSTVLDVGGGSGIHAGCLALLAKRVISADVCDNQVRYGGEFVKFLAEKFVRQKMTLAVDRVEFHRQDATSMMYRDDYFDFAYSINSFEHIPDPVTALAECARVLRPGGIIYITFAPIWTADSGSHFSHRVPDPWSHLVLTDAAFIEQMLANGADQNEVIDYKFAMNRKRLGLYLNLFDQTELYGLKKLAHVKWIGYAFHEAVKHPNFQICLCNGYSEEELCTNGMYLILTKI